MLNFSVGPVSSSDDILSIGAEQIPYFRTSEFSETMKENDFLMRKFVNAPKESRTVFLTASGTGSMEATIMNVLSSNDKAIVIDGGSFGHRFTQLCEIHKIPYTPLHPKEGMPITQEDLERFDNQGYTALIVNIHETSVGVLHNAQLLGDFCRRNNMLFIVDAISSFLADPIDMTAVNADVILTGSQKVLACAPGISIIVLSPKAVKRVEQSETKSMYFNLKDALSNAERGQTPFTPAVGILRQINKRLRNIDKNGGVESEIAVIKQNAEYFRQQITKFPFTIPSKSMSNAMTPLCPSNNISAEGIFKELKDNYNIWVCPNGGELRHRMFRVGHFGAIGKAEIDTLLNAFSDMQKRGLI